MAVKVASKVQPIMEGFDVTCLVGHVSFGEGQDSPIEAAMKLIGRHGAEGEYRFPHEDGGEWIVSMEHRNPQPIEEASW